MTKKMFALASISALAGLMALVTAAGCSSAPVPDAPGGGASDASEAGPKRGVDSSVTGQDVVENPPDYCPSTTAIDATVLPWKPPAVDLGKCQEQDILDAVAFIDANKTTTYAQIKAATKDAACATCLFVPDGAKWGPFVEKADGSFLRNNFGGCVAVKSTDACGQAYTQLDDCAELACEDCTDEGAHRDCKLAAAKGACDPAQKAYATACGDSKAADACKALLSNPQYVFEAAARALCVGP